MKLWIASASCIIVLKEFDVDLDGAQTLRFLGYKVVGDQTVLLGKCALEVCSGNQTIEEAVLYYTISCMALKCLIKISS